MGQSLKNNLVFYGASFLYKFINALPRRITLFLGEALGFLAHLIVRKERVKALTNLDRAYGNSLTFRHKKQIARDCFITFGRAILEAMRLRRHYDNQMKPDIEVIGREHLQKACDRGRGVIAITGHFGNFELLAAWAAKSGFKSAAIGRELYDKRLDELLINNRRAMGIRNVATSDSPRTMLRILKEGYILGALIDTDSFRVGGELTLFFNRPAKTPTGPTQLGLMAGAAFVPLFCFSFPGGKYRIEIYPEIIPESTERTRENIYKLTSRMTEVIEAAVRKYPEQWIWMHNRWHNRAHEDDQQFLKSIGIDIELIPEDK